MTDREIDEEATEIRAAITALVRRGGKRKRKCKPNETSTVRTADDRSTSGDL